MRLFYLNNGNPSQSYSWPNNGNIWSPMLMRQHLYTFYSNGSIGFPCFFHHVHEGMIRFYGSCGPMKNVFNVFNRPCSPRQIPMTWELSTRNFIAPSKGTMLCKASETVLLYCQLIHIEKNPTHDSRKLSCAAVIGSAISFGRVSTDAPIQPWHCPTAHISCSWQ